jgi:hypothetical protein
MMGKLASDAGESGGGRYGINGTDDTSEGCDHVQ